MEKIEFELFHCGGYEYALLNKKFFDGLRFDGKFPVDMEQRDLSWNKFDFKI